MTLARLNEYVAATPEHGRYLREQGPTSGLLQIYWDWAKDHGYRYPWVASAAAEFSEEFGGAAFLGAVVALYCLEVRNGGHHQCLNNAAGLDVKNVRSVFETMAEIYDALGFARTASGKEALGAMREFAKAAGRGRISIPAARRLDDRFFANPAWAAELERDLERELAPGSGEGRRPRGRERRGEDRLNRWRELSPETRRKRSACLLERAREADARGEPTFASEARALAAELARP